MLGRGTKLADLYLQVRINGDMALFQAVEPQAAGAPDAVDHAFVARHCGGFDELRAHLLRGEPIDVPASTG